MLIKAELNDRHCEYRCPVGGKKGIYDGKYNIQIRIMAKPNRYTIHGHDKSASA
jgi:hypothetical protein